jgi:hypothetical protein
MACTAPPILEDALALDLEADAGLGLANNDPIALWEDQSPSGNNAIQATGTNQPTFKSADGPGGRPCIHFDGTTDFLVLPDLPLVQRYTIFMVLKPANNAFHVMISGNTDALAYRHANNLKPGIARSNGAFIGEANTALSTSDFQQINLAWDGTSAMFRLSGAADGMVSSPTTFIQPINRIGLDGGTGDRWFEGDICMIKIFTGVLALDQIQAQEAAILAQWGV